MTFSLEWSDDDLFFFYYLKQLEIYLQPCSVIVPDKGVPPPGMTVGNIKNVLRFAAISHFLEAARVCILLSSKILFRR